MDRTAIASIIIGLGATVAAMVFPSKYPNAPKWAVNITWWGGLALILGGTLYLITEHPISDLGRVLIATFGRFTDHLIAIQRIPGFWIAIAFVTGLAVHRWGIPFFLTWIRKFSRGPV